MSTTPPPSKPRTPVLPRQPLGTGANASASADDLRNELQGWFDIAPFGKIVFDDTGLVVRHNRAMIRMFGSAPVNLFEAREEIRLLTGWPAELPGPGNTRTVDGWMADPQGEALRVRVHVRGLSPQLAARAGGGPTLRWIAMFEDRSAEDERDVARVEIQALMGTAGIGVATWDSSRGWIGASRSTAAPARQGSADGGLMVVARDRVEPESMADYDRLQGALRNQSRIEVRYAVRHPDGGRRWLMTRVEPAQLGTGRHAFSVVTVDVTEEETARRRNLDLLTELTTILDVSPAGIAYLRADRLVRSNRRFESLMGATARVAAGEPLAPLLAAAGIEPGRVAQIVHAVRDATALETEVLLPAGVQRPAPVWCSLALRRAPEGTPAEAGLVLVLSDATRLKAQQSEMESLARERELARESLVQQADRTRAILDSVLVGIVTVGAMGIEWMNRSARRMFGGELADFVGAPIAVVATDEIDHPLRRTDYGETLEEGLAETFECRLRARDGRTFWVVGNVVVTGQDTDKRQLTFALLDIERRRQAEVSIVQARASLQRIIETAPLAIALFDAGSQQVVQLNQTMASFAGRPAQEILGRVPAQWLPGPEGAKLAGDLHRALVSPELVQRELRRNDDGAPEVEPRVWDIRIVSLRSAADAPDQLLMVASDVTAQRVADEARLAAAIAQREMLIKEVHHRIKNNLQGVAGLLQQSAFRHPEAAGAIAEAVGQVHAIAQVHGLQVGVTGPMRVRGVVEAIAQSVQRMFGRTIDVVVSGAAPHRFALTEADSIPIALAVNELLTNAIKHSVAEEGEPQPPIRCGLECGDGAVTIAIANRGRLRAGFLLTSIPAGVSGLGLVRSLLPRKGATLALVAEGDEVVARLELAPPAVAVLEPL